MILFVFFNAASHGWAANKERVILGNCSWDADTGRKVSSESPEADFEWEHTIQGQAVFRTLEGALTAVLQSKNFDAVSKADVMAQNLLKRDLPAFKAKSKIMPGTIIVFKTNAGNYGKMRITGFRSSHDTDFDGAEQLTAAWKTFAAKKDPIENYHLAVEWEVFD